MRLAAVLIMLGLASQSWAAVAIDGTFEFNTSGAGADPTNLSVTVGDNTNRALFVWAWAGNTPDVSTWGATFNGDSMTVHYTQPLQSGLRGYRAWRLVAPDVGTLTLSLDLDSSYEISVFVLSVYNVDQSTPTGMVYVHEDSGGGTASSVTVSVTTTDGLVVDYVVVGGSVTNLTQNGAQTFINIIGSSGTGTYQGGTSYRTGTGSSLNMQWTWTEAQNITASAFNINAAAAPAVSPSAGRLRLRWLRGI